MGFAPFEEESYAQGKIISKDESVYRQGMIIQVRFDGAARVVADQFEFPNGMAITPDGHTLIVAETWGECLTAFDITANGSLTNRRIWAQIKGYNPDGICLDAEGAIWVAAFGSTDVLRVCEGGTITHRARVANTPLACMLGGVDRRTLFVATTATNQPEDAIARRSGCIETVRVEVAGAGLP
jgi:sugar lactone lactonase YvrE